MSLPQILIWLSHWFLSHHLGTCWKKQCWSLLTALQLPTIIQTVSALQLSLLSGDGQNAWLPAHVSLSSFCWVASCPLHNLPSSGLQPFVNLLCHSNVNACVCHLPDYYFVYNNTAWDNAFLCMTFIVPTSEQFCRVQPQCCCFHFCPKTFWNCCA